MQVWKYGAYAFAIAATLCLAAANVAWAWSLDDGVYRYVMITVSRGGRHRRALRAHGHDALSRRQRPRLGAGGLRGLGVLRLRRGQGRRGLAANQHLRPFGPALKASEAQKAASADLEAETANLAEIRQLMTGERREARLDALQRREKASLERIDRLRPQTFTPSVEPARSQYAGNELALALALWLLSQVAWKMAVGRMHGAQRTPRTPVRDEQPPVVLTVRPTVRQGVTDAVPANRATPPSANSKALEKPEQERVFANSEQSSEQPVRRTLSVVPKDAFAEQVLAYSRAGFSVRQIAKKMGCGATKVQNVLKPKTLTTTGNRV